MKEKNPKVLTFEQFAARHGGYSDWGDSAAHKQPGATEGSRRQLMKMLAKKDAALRDLRWKLYERYNKLVLRGYVRPPTHLEKLEDLATGHDDRQDVQAARRVLEKRKLRKAGLL